MIDSEERAVIEATVRGAIADALSTGADIDAAIARLGWLEMLEAEPDDAVEIVFKALGAINATATTLDALVASALGSPPVYAKGECRWVPRRRVWWSPLRR